MDNMGTHMGVINDDDDFSNDNNCFTPAAAPTNAMVHNESSFLH